jgi:hypothetical protein
MDMPCWFSPASRAPADTTMRCDRRARPKDLDSDASSLTWRRLALSRTRTERSRGQFRGRRAPAQAVCKPRRLAQHWGCLAWLGTTDEPGAFLCCCSVSLCTRWHRRQPYHARRSLATDADPRVPSPYESDNSPNTGPLVPAIGRRLLPWYAPSAGSRPIRAVRRPDRAPSGG